MPRIQPGSPSTIARTTQRAQAEQPKPPAAETPQVKAGWAPKTGAVGAPRGRPQLPEVATTAKAFVDAYASASKAQSQMDMVAGSEEINDAADELLKRVAGELSSQLADRGQDKKADAVLADLEKFMKKIGPTRGYRVDPERGSMASLEDNGERLDKVMAKLGQVAAELGKVNKEPSGEFQQAFNRHAGGEAVRNEALFAMAFQKAFSKNGDDKVITSAQQFFKTLPKKVDGQIESRGGSMEPLERAGATADALAEMTKKLSGG